MRDTTKASSVHAAGAPSRRPLSRLGPAVAAAATALVLSLPAPASADSNGKVVVASTATVESTKGQIRVFCNGPLSCHGTLTLVATFAARDARPKVSTALGSTSFKLAAGRSRVLQLKLTDRARKLLDSGRLLEARATGTGLHPHAVKLKHAG